MARTKRSAGGKTTLPQPPQFEQPPPSEPADIDALADGARYERQLWREARLDAQQAEDVSLDQVIARGVSLQGAELPLLQCVDSRFEATDFASARLEKAYMRRVAFEGCRLTGVALGDADLEDVRFTRCSAQLARIWRSTCRAVRFEQCMLQEASFDGSNLAGAVFSKCDLTRADFRDAKLAGADLRGSTITDIQIRPADLAGAIVDPAQAIYLMQLFKVTVLPEDT